MKNIYIKPIITQMWYTKDDILSQSLTNLGVVNEDGTVPSHTWAIDDDSIADQAIDDFGALVEDCGLWAELCKAKEEFQAAEEKLVNYAISLVPCKREREILTTSASNLKYRIKIIETVMKFDSTL